MKVRQQENPNSPNLSLFPCIILVTLPIILTLQYARFRNRSYRVFPWLSGNHELTRITTKSVLGRPSTEIVNFRRVPALARGVGFCLYETNLQTLVERDADST